MSERTRVNPETGVIEETYNWLNDKIGLWSPVEGPNGEITRIEPSTGEIQEQRSFGDHFFGIWHSKG